MRPAKIFVVSDTHFGHKRILEFTKRPYSSIEDHDKDLVLRWNSVVREQDTVWHLGDVYFGGKDKHEILAHLNGNKKLVLGNHDHYPLEIYQKYFTTIMGVMVLGKVVLTHIPIHPSELNYRFSVNVHGHMHESRILDAYHNSDPRYVCVSVEHTDLKPIPLWDVVKK